MELDPLLDVLPAAALAVLALMTVGAIYGLARRDNSVVDVFWGPAFVVGSWAAAVAADEWGPRTWLALALVTAWGGRLALHIGLRRRAHTGEDWRYANWRSGWGKLWWLWSIGKVFAFQGLLALIGSSALFMIVSSSDQALDVWAAVGCAVWALGFVTEVVADQQLARFRVRKARGEESGFITTGLWASSRHPNYLGEAIAWWGLSIIALGSEHGWIGLLSAVLVTTLVRYISGVPILEREWKKRDGFAAWAAVTPVFLPLPYSLRRDVS